MPTSMVDVPTADGTADALFVTPGGGPHPAVLMFMDAFGLRPRLTEMAERIASRGYAVLVPNLFYRAGRAPLVDLDGLRDPQRRAEIFGAVMPLIQALTPDRVTADSGSYLDFLVADGNVTAGPVAVVGYCMGGTNALRAAVAHPDRIAAMAAFHAGRLVTDAPDSPHRSVGGASAELYFAHAANDHSMSAEQVAALEQALGAAGATYRSEVYPGTQHGFTMADTAAYDADAEGRHWTNLLDLLDRVL
jgi:carboxymethylenebutenolidase